MLICAIDDGKIRKGDFSGLDSMHGGDALISRVASTLRLITLKDNFRGQSSRRESVFDLLIPVGIFSL